MTNDGVPRLCGGTFFTQILQSRKPTVSQRQRTQGESDVFHNEDVLFALLLLVQPDAIKPTGNSFETYTTNYKKCMGSIGEDLRFANETVMSGFTNRLACEYQAVLDETAAFCFDFIDIRETPQNHVKLVKRLIEIIRDDTSIADDEMFQIGRNGYRVNKKALPKVTEVNLPDFLLSVWAFIALYRKDNNIGRNTIVAWSDQRAVGRYTGNDGSSIAQTINVTIPPVAPTYTKTDEVIEDDPYIEKDEPSAEEPTPDPAPNVTNQIINAPAVFFNSGANVMQINNTGTINIDRGGKT
ncbi:MAG: hypothetical protein PHU51_05180 [Candidatus Nanoarchaeia archaeon]|jgi:hypothetical protein|nr:hypothetical protein [Candidatus Nanoarchaeia archaeon]